MEREQDLENNNWRLLKISEVNDENIKRLIVNLKREISDDFFITIDSLIKLERKAEPFLKDLMDSGELTGHKLEILKLILKVIKNHDREGLLILRLYHPDFLIRARAIMQAEKLDDERYRDFVLPLLRDPDDSVRWAAINFLIRKYSDDERIAGAIIEQIAGESNPVIKAKGEQLLLFRS